MSCLKNTPFSKASFKPYTPEVPQNGLIILAHGLSQQGVWVPFWTPKPLKRTPQDTQFF